MNEEFVRALETHQAAFDLDLNDGAKGRLAAYYDVILEHNEFLHLVAPMRPEEFAIRHILESLTLLDHLPANTLFADVGAGGGLPSIPCLLVRDDLKALLIESKEKKSKFLDLAVARLNLAARAEIVTRQFQEADPTLCTFITCRALDKFTEKLPRLIRWSGRRGLLLFGGENLKRALQEQKVSFVQKLMPLSEQRFLFVTKT